MYHKESPYIKLLATEIIPYELQIQENYLLATKVYPQGVTIPETILVAILFDYCTLESAMPSRKLKFLVIKMYPEESLYLN